MSYVSGFSGQALGKGSKAPTPRRCNGGSLSYGEGSAPLVSMGKTYGLSGSVLVQAVILPVEVDGYRSFAEALKGHPKFLLSTKGNYGNGASFSLKGQVTGKVASCFSSTVEVYLRQDRELYGETFNLQPLRDMLERLKFEVNHCFEWVHKAWAVLA
jgi:hypothetical protein